MCEVSLTTLVLGEINQVTSMMRKNARWAGASSTLGGSLASGSQAGHVSAMSAGLLAAEDDKAGLAKELGLRGSKSRDKLKSGGELPPGSTSMKASGSRDGRSRHPAVPLNKPAASLLSGFAALKNELSDLEGARRQTDCMH